MKISTNWLSEYLNLPETPEQIADRETVTGIEVDEIIKPSAGLKKIVVGKITALTPHPDSDHLNVCQVDVNESQPLQIICGAPNVAAGQTVIVALPGARIAHNQKIKRSKMRGLESQGMICSLQEIGFEETVVPEEFKNGIYVFPADAEVQLGDPVFSYLGMDDTILDFDITPNRADTLGMRGAAWEVAAMYDQKPHFPHPQLSEIESPTADRLQVNVTDPTLAPTYRMRVLQNVKIQPSPLWLQIHLWNNGIKPINNVVDITNYIMLDYGHPLHAFDLDKLKGNELQIRLAHPQEEFTALNGQTYQLTDQDMVIADHQQVAALAGIMGGQATKITADTKTIAIEAAVFNPVKVRKTAQRHNLRTEASLRCEKGIDLSATAEALDMAAQLVTQLAQAQALKDQIVAAQAPLDPPVINITTERINHVLGTKISQAQVLSIFKRLGFKTQLQGEEIAVTVPLRRWDISLEADLIEEVARLYGFDKLPSTLPVGAQTIGGYNSHQKFLRQARYNMRALGYDEVISYALTTQEKAAAFSIEEQSLTKVSWPMSHEHEYLRSNLVSGLLDDILYNVARKQTNLAFFEQGRIFSKANAKVVRPQEIEYLAGAVTGNIEEQNWQNRAQKVDFFAVKGDVEQLLASFNKQAAVSYQATTAIPQLHPGQAALILMNQQEVGFIGTVHPSYAQKLGLPQTVVFQLNLEKIEHLTTKSNVYVPAAKFPAVTRDIAVLVPQSVTHAQLQDIIQQSGGQYLIKVQLFDIYEGKNIKSGYKSVAYNLTFQNRDATLTDAIVNENFENIEQALQEQIDAEIR